MIWNYIRDFFVQYLFGGYASDNDFYGGFVIGFLTDGQNGADADNSVLCVNIGNNLADGYGNNYLITIGDWLSTTATIITLVIILVAIGLFIRWLFRLVSGLITFRG